LTFIVLIYYNGELLEMLDEEIKVYLQDEDPGQTGNVDESLSETDPNLQTLKQ
jgi:hypothetical protein